MNTFLNINLFSVFTRVYIPSLLKSCLVITFCILVLNVLKSDVSAQVLISPHPTVTVSARVGSYSLSLSGWASPFASIIMRSEGVFYRSTTADENGYWVINDITVNENFSSFCLEHIDLYNLGSSNACLTVPPAKSDLSKDNIFLPPTISLQRVEISAGGSAVVSGYSMPNSTVTIHLSNGESYEVTADGKGRYELTINNLSAGSYELYATAVYKGKASVTPTSTVKLVALTWWQMILKWIKNLFKSFWIAITDIGLGPLWFMLPLIPLIIFLIVRIWPERFTFIYESRMFGYFHSRRKLHHSWFIGY